MHHSFTKTAAGGRLAEHQETPVIFLPGWGFDGRICTLIQPAVDWIYPETMLDPKTLVPDILAYMESTGIGRVELVGWSMGGMLALDFARKHPECVSKLTLVSMRARWPAHEISRLRQELAADPTGFLKGFYRKCFIGNREKSIFAATLQPEYLAAAETAQDLLQRGLDYLGRELINPATTIETRLIHGRKDVVAPLAEMVRLPEAEFEILQHCGHIPFLSKKCTLHPGSRQATIRQHFSRAAATYDEHATVQKELAGRLAVKLEQQWADRKPKSVLELGCGTGNYTGRIADVFPASSILALDCSRTMLTEAKRKLVDHRNVDFIFADGEEFLGRAIRLSLSFDLITSNSTLQWFTDLGLAFSRINHHLLGPDGLLVCSLFGPRTLEELGEGLTAVFGRRVRLAATRFPGRQELEEILAKNFPAAELEEITIAREYSTARDLLAHIRNTGTGGWNTDKPLPFSRQRLNQLDRWFNDTHGGCRVSYQAFLVKAGK